MSAIQEGAGRLLGLGLVDYRALRDPEIAVRVLDQPRY
jgi:hypothetical protein